MHNLVVLSGHMGAGKSTLVKNILKKNSQVVSADVFKCIVPYKDEKGYISDENTAKAYEELYEELATLKQDVILEIGVRNPEFNLAKLGNLKSRFNITIVFCLLDKEICIERVMERGKQGQKYVIERERLENKFKIPFPDIHLSLANQLQIPTQSLDMSKPQEELSVIVLDLFS